MKNLHTSSKYPFLSSLCDSLTASLAISLENFANVEKREADRLQKKSDDDTELFDLTLGRYLHGGRGEKDDGEGLRLKNLQKTFANIEWRPGGGGSSSEKKLQAANVHTATVRNQLEEVRIQQCTSELSRFKYLRRMESLKERRTFELGETILASLHGIRAYFHHISDLTNGLAPRLARLQETQTNTRLLFNKQQEPWNKREQQLKTKIAEVSVAHKTSSDLLAAIVGGKAMGIGTTIIATEDPSSLSKVEDEVGIWKIGSMINATSLYERDASKGVITEGWLYKKSSGRMALHTWNKRWFVLDKEGLHYLRGGVLKGHAHGLIGNATMERVKVADILLCTVRESSSDKTLPRFCFEIISPNNRPYTLQARGPQDFQMWVEGIRGCIEQQLISGGPPSSASTLTSAESSSMFKENGGGEDDDISRKTSDAGTPSMVEKQLSAEGVKKALKNVKTSQPTWNPNRKATSSSEADLLTDSERLSMAAGNKTDNEMVKQILKSNPRCADCGDESPDWVSLNLGVLFCLR